MNKVEDDDRRCPHSPHHFCVGCVEDGCNGGETTKRIPVTQRTLRERELLSPVMSVESGGSCSSSLRSRKLGEFQKADNLSAPGAPLYLSPQLHQIIFALNEGADAAAAGPGGAAAADPGGAAAAGPDGAAAAGLGFAAAAPPAPKATGPTRFFLRKWFLGFTAGKTIPGQPGQLAPMYGRAEFQNKQLDQSVIVWVKSGAFLSNWQAGMMGRGALQLGFVHLTRKEGEEYAVFLERVRNDIEVVESVFRHRWRSVEAMRDIASIVKRNEAREEVAFSEVLFRGGVCSTFSLDDESMQYIRRIS